MKCLILAGGFATRLYPLTIDKAKALLEIKGKPVINHIIDRVPNNIEVLVSTNKKFETDFKEWQKTLRRPVEILIEEALTDDRKLGAVGAIDYWIKRKDIKEDIVVIAADNYLEFDLTDLMAKFDGKNVMIAVHDVGDKDKACDIGKKCQLGLVILDGTKVIRLDEKPPEPTSSIIATGIYVLPQRIFPLLAQYCRQKKRDNLGEFINFLLSKEEVFAYPFTEVWADIGDEITKGRLFVHGT